MMRKHTRIKGYELNHDPLRPHSHEPNPVPPGNDPAFRLTVLGGSSWLLTPADLATLSQTAISNCYIVSTGHGSSGPFTFEGVTLGELVAAYFHGPWQDVEIISADGFGTRVLFKELQPGNSTPPILVATQIDGRPMTREEGLVRLIVPSEKDDALRQVKWISIVTVNSVQ
jgi:hypothetical protein